MTAKSRIYQALARDPVWSGYAICDLEEPMFSQCEWHTRGDALLLVCRALQPPLLFAMGSGRELEMLIERAHEFRVWVNFNAEQEAAFRRHFDVTHEHAYVRMDIREFVPHRTPSIRLGPSRLTDLEQLYAAGAAPIFSPSQLDTGYFRGIEVNGELVSAAGVHVLSRTYGVATVGNVATRQDYCGRGFASACTAAVVSALLSDGYRTIVLNVESGNGAAIRAYERVGFRRYCEFIDARAVRRR